MQITGSSPGSDPTSGVMPSYEDAYLNPWQAAERGLVDEVIDPADSRIALCAALRQLCTKRETMPGRKHDAGPQ